MFASAVDVETKLKPKLGRSFTTDETAAAELLLEGATAAIEVAVDRTEEAIGNPPPRVLKFVAIEMVCRAWSNPQGLASTQESLGAYSHAERYLGENGGAPWLTELEETMVRRAVLGQLSGTAEVTTILSDPCVLCGLVPRLVGDIEICGCCDS